MINTQRPKILWDLGTAYDLFASLHVLHRPEKFGLRGSWAAGVRSRLTPAQRTVLEDAQELFFTSPLVWVSSLPEPRDAATVIRALVKIEPAERLPKLASHAGEPAKIIDTLSEVSARHSWSNADLERVQQYYRQMGRTAQTNRSVIVLDWWARAEEFGERFLSALQAYVTNFFTEEERRISSYLQQALEKAQRLAGQLDFTQLMVELSHGVKIAALEGASEVVVAPSYWIAPLVMYDCVIDDYWVFLFGARPAEESLVPGEAVPNAMLQALKALSDPTRLLILRYLSDQPQTPSQLARRLRLRAPTVIHHLSALRLAGLVNISMDKENEKRYTVRKPAVNDTFDALHQFLMVNGDAKA